MENKGFTRMTSSCFGVNTFVLNSEISSCHLFMMEQLELTSEYSFIFVCFIACGWKNVFVLTTQQHSSHDECECVFVSKIKVSRSNTYMHK